jgi:hypothetical protein
MGQSLDAYAVYGFSTLRCADWDYETNSYVENHGLPTDFTQGLTDQEIADASYIELEDLDLGTIIEGVVKLKYPLLYVDFPGTEEGDEMVVYIQRTKVNAYYTSEPLVLEDATPEEEAQIRSLALILGKTPSWLIYPTYG